MNLVVNVRHAELEHQKATKLMNSEKWDVELLNDLADVMSDSSICGLGQAASNPLKSVIKYFPEEIKK